MRIKTYKCMLVSEGTQDIPRTDCSSADNAAAIFFERLAGLPHEEVHVLYLNGRNRVIGCEVVSKGGAHGAALTPRDVLRGAIVAGASAIIMAHNHPSGDPHPSVDDYSTTHLVRLACEAVGLPLLDHLVVCPEIREYRSCM